MEFLKYIPFTDRIIIYWGYEHYSKNIKRDFCIDDVKIATTYKTHFTFNNLASDTLYTITIKENDNLFVSISIKTLKERDKIIVNYQTDKNLTNQLQQIFDNASGKEVIFPKGDYHTGALFIKPNTHIKFEKGARLIGSLSSKDYLPLIHSRFEGLTMKCYASLINIGSCDYSCGYEKGDIYLYGEGEIIGGGNDLATAIISDTLPLIDTKNIDSSKTNPSLLAGRYRGRLIQINNSQNIVIEGLKLGYSPSWNLHFIYSKNIVVTNCFIVSKGIHNGDGIDPDSSENIDIFNNSFDTSDDCIAIKSGRNPDGNKINRPSKNISVFDCCSIKGHGCCIGSEMSGGIENIYFFDCDFSKTRFGVQIKTTKKRGGYVKNVYVKDLKLSAINIRTVTYNDEGESANALARFNNFQFTDITLTGIDIGDVGNENKLVNHIEINGFEENKLSFCDFYLRNINFASGEARTIIKNCYNVKIND